MARPLRIEYEGAFYHVMNRGLERQEILQEERDYEKFLELLEEQSGVGGQLGVSVSVGGQVWTRDNF